MEGGSLFNPGFLGAQFLWWVGQIADDSTWRDNILPGKFENAESIPGWGRRYKVRIIGLHDKEEEAIPSSELPWAQVMYPITAGGGQSAAGQTPALRQGNFVFGFFLDGQDQQVPVIMGVMGNNAQTLMHTKIGNNDSNFAATSGYSEGKDPKKGTAKEKVPDDGKVITKPKSKDQQKESALASKLKGAGTGILKGINLSPQQLIDSQNARDIGEKAGLSGSALESFIQSKVAAGIQNRSKESNSPNSGSKPGATKENSDAVHQQTSADVKKKEKYEEKIVLMKPDDPVGSAIKAIQTIIDNLTKKINKFLSSMSNYVDAVSGPPQIGDIKKMISDAACAMSKYVKIIMDKVMEYVNKTLNKELTKTVSAMPSSKRYQFADMKFLSTENTLKLYNGITEKMCGLMDGILNTSLNVDSLIEKAQKQSVTPTPGVVGLTWELVTTAVAQNEYINTKTYVPGDTVRFAGNSYVNKVGSTGVFPPSITGLPGTVEETVGSTPKVPICYAEDVIGQAISSVRTEIDAANNSVVENMNVFLTDVKSELEEVDASNVEKADEGSDLGKVYKLTDEEVLDQTRGGSGYITATGCATSWYGSTIPQRTQTDAANGTGLTVDITVSTGGATNQYTTLETGGSGYVTGNNLTTSGGSGSGCKVNVTASAGAIVHISIAAPGTGYEKDDVLTVNGGTGGTFKIITVVGAIDDGGIKVDKPGTGYVVGDVDRVNAGNNDAIFMIIGVTDPGQGKAEAAKKAPKLASMNFDISSMVGSMTSALNFKNLPLNFFSFELPPNVAVSDFYQFATGGSGQPDSQLPSTKAVGEAASKPTDAVATEEVGFSEPHKDQSNVNLDDDSTEEGTFEMY